MEWNDEAWEDGHATFNHPACDMDMNPYSEDTHEWHSWNAGFVEHADEYQAERDSNLALRKTPCATCGTVPTAYLTRSDCWYVRCECRDIGGTRFQSEAWDRYFSDTPDYIKNR